jgi:hypothetical protein
LASPQPQAVTIFGRDGVKARGGVGADRIVEGKGDRSHVVRPARNLREREAVVE